MKYESIPWSFIACFVYKYLGGFFGCSNSSAWEKGVISHLRVQRDELGDGAYKKIIPLLHESEHSVQNPRA